MTADSDELNAQVCSILVNYFVAHTIKTIVSSMAKHPKVNPSAIVVLRNAIGTKPYPLDDFEALKKFKDDLIVNNFNVNRMDNRGRYVIRQLIRSYMSDPRQLPDNVLKTFMEMKKAEMVARGKDAFKSWFTDVSSKYNIVRLESKQIESVISIIDKDSHGTGMRHAPHEILNALVPYLVSDSDYLRTVADYISSMSDRFAETECAALYE